MPRLLVLTLALTLALLSGTAAQATPITYYATLSGLNEAPPNASPGTGLAFITIDPAAHLMRVQVTFQDLVAGNTASHIHVINGPGDANTLDTLGPVATTTPTFFGFPSGVTSGSYDYTYDTSLALAYRAGFVTDATSLALAEAALFDAITSGRAYVNIHTSTFPGGEIRGFLAPVPDPGSTLLLFGIGLAGLRAWRRRWQ